MRSVWTMLAIRRNVLFYLRSPQIDFVFGLLSGVAVMCLQKADEFRPLAIDGIDIAIAQFAPFRSQQAFVLFPISFDLIPVHRSILDTDLGDAGHSLTGRARPTAAEFLPGKVLRHPGKGPSQAELAL